MPLHSFRHPKGLGVAGTLNPTLHTSAPLKPLPSVQRNRLLPAMRTGRLYHHGERMVAKRCNSSADHIPVISDHLPIANYAVTEAGQRPLWKPTPQEIVHPRRIENFCGKGVAGTLNPTLYGSGPVMMPLHPTRLAPQATALAPPPRDHHEGHAVSPDLMQEERPPQSPKESAFPTIPKIPPLPIAGSQPDFAQSLEKARVNMQKRLVNHSYPGPALDDRVNNSFYQPYGWRTSGPGDFSESYMRQNQLIS